MRSSAALARQKQAQLLNELTKNGVEPQDEEVRKKYEEFKISVTQQALKVLKERIPAKILYFNELVNINSGLGELLHDRDLQIDEPVVACPGEGLTNGAGSEAAGTTSTQGHPIASAADEKQPVTTQSVPTHSQIVEMKERVARDALELIEMVGTVRLWIQLNVPRIEDGNNFGVAIQEEAIQELGRVEDAAFNLCDGIKYHASRAKFISKLLKYPNIADYSQSIREIDRKEWLHLKVSMIEMRNNYSMLYDLLHKNWEKVVKPRAADSNRMVM